MAAKRVQDGPIRTIKLSEEKLTCPTVCLVSNSVTGCGILRPRCSSRSAYACAPSRRPHPRIVCPCRFRERSAMEGHGSRTAVGDSGAHSPGVKPDHRRDHRGEAGPCSRATRKLGDAISWSEYRFRCSVCGRVRLRVAESAPLLSAPRLQKYT